MMLVLYVFQHILKMTFVGCCSFKVHKQLESNKRGNITCLMPWYAHNQNISKAAKNETWKMASNNLGIQLCTRNVKGNTGSKNKQHAINYESKCTGQNTSSLYKKIFPLMKSVLVNNTFSVLLLQNCTISISHF